MIIIFFVMKISSVLRCIALVLSVFALCACPGVNPDGPDDPIVHDDPDNPSAGKTVKVVSISVDRTEVILNVGGVDSIDYFIEPENATDKSVTWESSDPSVVEVDEEGTFTATGPGTAIVTVRTNDGGKTASCTVSVRKRLFDESDYGKADDDGKCRYKYGSRTIVLSEDTAALFFDVSKEGFRVNDSDLGGSPVYAGDVFVFPASEIFPEGYAAVVRSSDATGSDEYKVWNIHTAPATLEEVFEDLHFSTMDLDLASNVDRVLDEDGAEVQFTTTKASAGFQIQLPTAFGISSNISLGENCSVTPNLVLGFKMDAECDLSWCRLNKFRTRIEHSAKLDVAFALKASGTQNIFKSKKYSFIFGTFPVGPVTLHPVITAKLNVDLTGEVSLTTNLHFYMDEYFELGYTKEGGAYADYGTLPEPEETSPVTVSGALSGGISVGPDIGIGLSIWAGALQLTLDLQPRLNGTFNSSIPFNKETLVNLMSGAMAADVLAQSYFESSFSLKFGGSFDYGWKGSTPFSFPGDLSYSLCKLYLIPSLAPSFNYTVTGNNVQFVTSIKKQNSIYDKNMFIVLEYQDRESENSSNYVTKRINVPLSLDGVRLTGVASNLPRGHYYNIVGPKIGISAFDCNLDLLMYPVQQFDRTFYIEDKADYPMEELRPILKDIIDSVPGFYTYYPDCNWEDPDAENFWNVRSSLSYGINEVEISLPYSYITRDWSINIGRHPTSFNWLIKCESESGTLKSLVIDNDTCCGVFMGFAEEGRLEVHSKALRGNGDYGSAGSIDFYKRYPKDVDLSRSGIENLNFLSGISGTLKLDDCPSLRTIWSGMMYNDKKELIVPASVSASGTSLNQIFLTAVKEDKFGFLKNFNTKKLTLELSSATTLSGIPDIAEELSVTRMASAATDGDMSIIISGATKLKTVEVPISINSLRVSGCPNLSRVSVESTCLTLDIPKSEKIVVGIAGEGPLPDWTASYSTSGVRLEYNHKFTYSYDYELVGQDPTDKTKNVYTRNYKGYSTAEHGLYYPWEPGRGYHCNGHYYMENSNYPNERSEKTNQ